ncbi:sigma 54-interacting transcriptional regulator [Pseudoalteromonas xiamenensis]|uniref:sigma-54 interaction domain-containing protein n=1 Tax=Pseudoalteromonas xiamenensis TaxID=882626 RepID=UPI0027E3B2E7|nr:sigma 54-interacting transcriptional regulator [Pseudoalteromonas xiamenensis]WMN60203.1 sigma 54-interacting transcriptional regulator [Pseudoalteromonas xiamenensis]
MNSPLKQFLSDPEILLNSVGEGIYGFDLEGNAVFVNPAAEKMTGWMASELIGKRIHEYHHHSHADGSVYPAEHCKIYQTLKDGNVRNVKNEVFWRKDGSRFPVEYTTTPIMKDNTLIGAVAIFRDISIQTQTEHALRDALTKVQQLSEQLQEENEYLTNELNADWRSSGMVGQSERFLNVLQQVELVSKTESTVLIQGENGTGKELIARSLHRLGNRKNQSFIKVNCAAFSESLLESELFGHEKGAFTGAVERRKGRFELAHGGTLFLDEIGELSLAAQSKLLRVLQESEFERVGGQQTIKVDIRLIAATNRDLLDMVGSGTFRMDLFYRLNVFPIMLPPLRERIEDIPLLATEILALTNHKLGTKLRGISKSALKKFMQYSWPGNIRELQNVIEREAILNHGGILKLSTPLLEEFSQHVVTNQTLDEAIAQHIVNVLNYCDGRISGPKGAATILDVPESTLRSKMKKLGVNSRNLAKT